MKPFESTYLQNRKSCKLTLFPILTCILAGLLGGAAARPAVSTELFNRIASFPVNRNLPAGADAEQKTSAETLTAHHSGNYLAYADSQFEAVGIIDITEPSRPVAAGSIKLDAEPTSIAWVGNNLLVAVDTSESFSRPSGELRAYAASGPVGRSTVSSRNCQLPGQPDSITASADNSLLAIAIENQHDEELGDGMLPQLPAGSVVVIRLQQGQPDCSTLKVVELTGLAELAPNDPEPESIAFNSLNELAVTLQENNHIVIIDAGSGKILNHFSAGEVALVNADIKEDGALTFDARYGPLAREPDAIQWLDTERVLTANEGDYQGGSRGFSIFSRDGAMLYDSGLTLEHEVAIAGHYPEARSANRGIEPEGLAVGNYNNVDYFFVSAERASVIGVYKYVSNNPGSTEVSAQSASAPEFIQLLPSGISPEGLVTLPSRDLLVSSNELDLVEDNGPRSHIMIYQLGNSNADYPQIKSTIVDGKPLGWGALSGLASDKTSANILYAVNDSFYAMQPSVFTIDNSSVPAIINSSITVTRNGKVAEDLDLEGIASDDSGGFWLASENSSDEEKANSLYHINAQGEIQQEITLPRYLQAQQKSAGFEGLTSTGNFDNLTLWIAVQREWKDDRKGLVKVLSYTPASGAWGAVHYPLEAGKKGRRGISAIEAHGGYLYLTERDNLAGELAKTKKLFRIELPTTVALKSDGFLQKLPVVQKVLVHDFVPDLLALNGFVQEKIEGFTIAHDGRAWAVTDNDGVDDHSGETLFFSIGNVDDLVPIPDK